jgi:hypothetical protein
VPLHDVADAQVIRRSRPVAKLKRAVQQRIHNAR